MRAKLALQIFNTVSDAQTLYEDSQEGKSLTDDYHDLAEDIIDTAKTGIQLVPEGQAAAALSNYENYLDAANTVVTVTTLLIKYGPTFVKDAPLIIGDIVAQAMDQAGSVSAITNSLGAAAGEAAISSSATLQPTSSEWKAGNGNWFTAANWSAGLPTTAIAASIPEKVIVTFNGAASVRTLYMTGSGTTASTLQMGGGTLTFDEASTIANLNLAGGTLKFVGEGASYIGLMNQTGGTIDVGSGVVDARAGGTVKGAITGSGTFEFGEGSFTIASPSISVAQLVVGPVGALSLAAGLTYGGDFEFQSNGPVIYLNGNVLTLTGTGELEGKFAASSTVPTAGPASEVQVTGTLDVNDLHLDGAVSLSVTHIITQSGALWFDNGETTEIAAGATWNITGNIIDYASETSPKGTIVNAGLFEKTGGTGNASINVGMTNTGQIVVSTGTMSFLGSLANTGVMTASGGVLFVNTTPTGIGNFDMRQGGVLEFGKAVSASSSAIFQDATGVLKLDDASGFAGKITGMGHGDTIDITGNTGLSETYANGVLTLSRGGSHFASLNVSGNFTTSSFQLLSDGHGGTSIGV